MASTRELLEGLDDQLAESMGKRSGNTALRVAPMPRAID